MVIQMERERIPELVRQAQSGDGQAMEELLKAAHTYVSYQCRKFMKNTEDAEDMSQEVLLKIYNSLDSLEEPEKFISWANSIAARRCINERQRNPRDLQFAEDRDGGSIMDDIAEQDEQKIPDSAIDRAETARMMAKLVNELPEAQRMCTYLFYYDGMSVNEIAEAMGVSGNTVKSRLYYARRSIKDGVLDYEKQGVKFYGLSPLPFLAFFLRRAAESSADEAAAGAMVRRVLSAPAPAAAAGSAGASGAAGTADAGGAAGASGGTATATAAKSAGFFGTVAGKIIAAVAAVAVVAGGAAVVANLPEKDEPEETPPPVVETVPPATTEAPAVELSLPFPDAEEEIPDYTLQATSFTSEYAGCYINYLLFNSESAGYQEINRILEQSVEDLLDYFNKQIQEGTPVWVEDHYEFKNDRGSAVIPTSIVYEVKDQNERYLTIAMKWSQLWPSWSMIWDTYLSFDVKTGERLTPEDVLDGTEQEIMDRMLKYLEESLGFLVDPSEAQRLDMCFYIEDGRVWFCYPGLSLFLLGEVSNEAYIVKTDSPAVDGPGLKAKGQWPDEPATVGCSVKRVIVDLSHIELQTDPSLESYGLLVFDSQDEGYKAINRYFEEIVRSLDDVQLFNGYRILNEMPADLSRFMHISSRTFLVMSHTGSYLSVEVSSHTENLTSGESSDVVPGYYNFDTRTGEPLELGDLIDGTEDEIMDMVKRAIEAEYPGLLQSKQYSLRYRHRSNDPSSYQNFYIKDGEIHYVLVTGEGNIDAVLPVRLI